MLGNFDAFLWVEAQTVEAFATGCTFDSLAKVAPVPHKTLGWPGLVAVVENGLKAETVAAVVHFAAAVHLEHFHLLLLLF